MTNFSRLDCRTVLASAAGVSMIVAACLTLLPEPASACGNGYGANYRNCSGGGGGGYRYSGGGGGVDYGGAAAAAIGMLPVAVDILGGIANTASEIGANANFGPTQQEIYDNVTSPPSGESNIQLPNPFNIFGSRPNAEPQQAKQAKLPPNCPQEQAGSFQSNGEQQLKTALTIANNTAENPNAADYEKAASLANEAAEQFRCAKNAKARNQALGLARQAQARANKYAAQAGKQARKQQVQENNWRWNNFTNRGSLEQIKQEIRQMHEKGMKNKKIIETLKSKGYTTEDINSAISEMQEAKNQN